MKRVVVAVSAQLELQAAAAWYSQQQEGLGVELVLHVNEAIAKIAAGPTRFPLWRRDRPYRRALVQRFPYVVFFVDHNDGVEVLAIAHQKRKPGFWLHRRR